MRPATAVIFCVLAATTPLVAAAEDFEPIFSMLETHCGHCHRRGGASAWMIDVAPTEARYPECRDLGSKREIYRCTTWAQLVESPGDEIPAWIRPDEARSSEPFVQACDEQSFHLGVSLQELLPESECREFLEWIIGGANR